MHARERYGSDNLPIFNVTKNILIVSYLRKFIQNQTLTARHLLADVTFEYRQTNANKDRNAYVCKRK